MPIDQQHPVLRQTINDIDVSENFRDEFLRAGFLTLGDALEFDADTLVTQKKLSYHTITELIQFLNSYGLGRMFKD
jgi:DNA-directed RNA polymerase alpha subunit